MIMAPPPFKRRIAIIGAGFTGSVLAAHLLRNADGPTSIHLIERAESVGTGLAYSTACSAHVLNVRAYNMSAFPDDSRHFLRWLGAQEDGGSIPPSGHAFVSRTRYGANVQDVLNEARAAPRRTSRSTPFGPKSSMSPCRPMVSVCVLPMAPAWRWTRRSFALGTSPRRRRPA